MQTPAERSKQLAEDHWKYVKATIAVHNPTGQAFTLAEVMAIAEHHYLTAAQHFYGHAVEDVNNGLFRPRIGSPLSPEEVEKISKEVVNTPPICASCARGPAECSHSAETVKWCGWYFSNLREQIAEAEEPQPLDLSLPTITICCTPSQIMEKFKEEVEEYAKSASGSMSQFIEAWDVIQVAQTYREHGGADQDLEISAGIVEWNLKGWHETDRPVMQAKAAMLLKNATRGYYSPEVNQIIIETNGECFTP